MKDVTVPTKQELKRAARLAGLRFDAGFARSCYDYLAVFPEPQVTISYVEYDRTGRTAYRQARYLTGQHIEALKRMQEAGL